MKSFLSILMAAALAGCAGTGGLGSVARTTQLQTGMSEAQVQQLMGTPASVQRGESGAIWKYSLHEYYKGWVSHHLLFAGEPRRLQAWAADEAEYQRNQAMWLQALANAPSANSGRKAPGTDDCSRGSWEDRTFCKQLKLQR